VDNDTNRTACETQIEVVCDAIPPGNAQDVCVQNANIDFCGDPEV
jgi:hypothetical protein